MGKRHCLIPQRQLKWKKYAYLTNKDQNIYFACECGKKYVSFQALYLHFQRKHNMKISNNDHFKGYQIRKTGEEVIYFYFLNKNQTPVEIASPAFKEQFKITSQTNHKNSNLHQILYIFMLQNSQMIGKKAEKSFLQKIIENLQNFVLNDCNEKQNEQELLQNLPFYFNQFTFNQVEVGIIASEKEYKSVCKLLHLLSRWLNDKNYSNLRAELNNSL